MIEAETSLDGKKDLNKKCNRNMHVYTYFRPVSLNFLVSRGCMKSKVFLTMTFCAFV